MATASISDAGLSGEQLAYRRHGDDLDHSEGIDLVVIRNIVFMLDVH